MVGPFSAQELLSRAGFGSHSLVCPEEHSDEETFWKEACYYEEFGFAPQQSKPAAKIEAATAAQTEQFLKEMDTVMTELSSFSMIDKGEITAKTEEKKDSAEKETPLKEEVSTLVSQSSKKDSSLPDLNKISSLLMEASEDMKKKKEEGENKESLALESDSDKETVVSPQTMEEQESSPVVEPQVNPAVQLDPETEVVARTISKVSPLEEYFNTMKSGDLGNILGIPDPKENSDMNLSRALKDQFEKTEPEFSDHTGAEDPFDAFVSSGKPEELDEALFAPTPAEADKQTEEQLKKDLPDLQSARPLSVGKKGLSFLVDNPELEKEATQPPAVQEMIVPEQDDDPNDRTVKTILEGKIKVDTLRQEILEPIKDVPTEDAKKVPTSEQERALADDEEEFLQERVVKSKPESKLKFIGLGFGILVLLVGVFLNWTQEDSSESKETPVQAEEKVPSKAETGLPSARQTIQAMASAENPSPAELAKQVVQNYVLDSQRGTIEQYLNNLYQKELQSGYAALWSAELLHNNVYVVKYRLAKTRKEPIVYIFQVDTVKKKLTGALNNITLDLVGKIR